MRTSGYGWRIVAIGALIVIFGLSGMMNNVGPAWIWWVLSAIGAIVIVVGRQL